MTTSYFLPNMASKSISTKVMLIDKVHEPTIDLDREFRPSQILCPGCDKSVYCTIYTDENFTGVSCCDKNQYHHKHVSFGCNKCKSLDDKFMFAVPIKGNKYVHKDFIPKLVELYGDIHVTDEYEGDHYTVILPEKSYIWHDKKIATYHKHLCKFDCKFNLMVGACENCGISNATGTHSKFEPKYVRKLDWWPARQQKIE